jgi:hypothetical protein
MLVLKTEVLLCRRGFQGDQADGWITDQIGHRQESIALRPQLPLIAFPGEASHQFAKFFVRIGAQAGHPSIKPEHKRHHRKYIRP